jgi:hypothetical protein
MKKIALILSFLILGNYSWSQVILSWGFSSIPSGSGNQPVPSVADIFGSNISTSSPSGELTRGAGIAASSRAGGFSAAGFSSSTTDFAGALAADDFFTFSVAPDSGFSINLSSLDINFDTSATGPQNWGLFSSVDGFTSAIDTFTADVDGASHNLSIGDASYDTLTSSVEFRLVGHGASSGSGTAAFVGSGADIVLNGITSAIPEPSTYALIFGGFALGVVMLKRRITAFSS